jgi:hypothetical protein
MFSQKWRFAKKTDTGLSHKRAVGPAAGVPEDPGPALLNRGHRASVAAFVKKLFYGSEYLIRFDIVAAQKIR